MGAAFASKSPRSGGGGARGRGGCGSCCRRRRRGPARPPHSRAAALRERKKKNEASPSAHAGVHSRRVHHPATAGDAGQIDRRRDGRGRGGETQEHTSELQSLAYLVCRLL